MREEKRRRKQEICLWKVIGCRSCGRVPPIVKSAVPVEGRFEHVVLSCDATKDHSLVQIEKESSRALEVFVYVNILMLFSCFGFEV